MNLKDDGITGVVKHERKKQEVGFLLDLVALLATWLMQPMVSSLVKRISWRGVRRVGRRYTDKNFASGCSFKQYQNY